MEFRPLAELLEDLLSAGDVDGEIHLAAAIAPEIEDFVGLREEYEQRYARAVAGVCELRGGPTFAGTPGDLGFPMDLRADYASCWNGANGTIFLALRLRSDGFLLFGGARALPPSRRDFKTLQPPPS
jgi:hypothetical protein